MSEQLATVGINSLEQAIQTVIHDLRIPEKLRTDLAVYQGLQDDPNNLDIGVLRAEQKEPTCLPKTIRSSAAGVCQRRYSQTARQKGRNCEFTLLEQDIGISISLNNDSLDWSIEIDGLLHEHVTSEVMEALVECSLIVAQSLLIRGLTQRPQ
jgi:hypothetical protein